MSYTPPIIRYFGFPLSEGYEKAIELTQDDFSNNIIGNLVTCGSSHTHTTCKGNTVYLFERAIEIDIEKCNPDLYE